MLTVVAACNSGKTTGEYEIVTLQEDKLPPVQTLQLEKIDLPENYTMGRNSLYIYQDTNEKDGDAGQSEQWRNNCRLFHQRPRPTRVALFIHEFFFYNVPEWQICVYKSRFRHYAWQRLQAKHYQNRTQQLFVGMVFIGRHFNSGKQR